MALMQGVIIPPSYGMLKVADQLSTKVAVKGVTAGNERERVKFLTLCKQVRFQIRLSCELFSFD